MLLIDISRPLSPRTATWPGDTVTSLTRMASIEDGAEVNVSTLTASVHNATHLDAPIHYEEGGKAIDDLALANFIGPCRVIDVRGHDPIDASLIPREPGRNLPPRVLFKTGAWEDSTIFPRNYPIMAGQVPAMLAELGVKLVGVDVPSVDRFGGKGIPMHHACRAAGLLILESLDLSAVAPGDYELIALPVLIPGSDGAFVRAVLRSHQ